MISRLIEDLKQDEGFEPSVYRDSIHGYLTIGYGFLVDPKVNGEIPQKIADLWLEHLAEEKWAEVCKELPWMIAQPEDVQRAVTNMAYQMGVRGVMGFKLMLKALERGDRETAAENALRSTWAKKQTPARAKRVTDLMRGYKL